jgi:LmbE family N-acetylglucosaminyl deacetylase
MKRVLLLSPHPDDIELGCGATISRLIDEGHELYACIFSSCEESIPKDFNKEELINENLNSLLYLGLKNKNIIYYNYNVRNFDQKRQSILNDILKLKKEINPDIVFVPSTEDVHQDHHVITNEAIKIFKNTTTIYGYQLLWNTLVIKNNFIIEVKEEHLYKKITALNFYKTQSQKKYFNSDYIKSLAIINGINTETKYAESFEIIYKINRI